MGGTVTYTAKASRDEALMHNAQTAPVLTDATQWPSVLWITQSSQRARCRNAKKIFNKFTYAGSY
jgi:hypothetical protein